MESGDEQLHIVTPTIQSMPLSKIAGFDVYLKLENLQIPGSFKIRGIGNLIKQVLFSFLYLLVLCSLHIYSNQL